MGSPIYASIWKFRANPRPVSDGLVRFRLMCSNRGVYSHKLVLRFTLQRNPEFLSVSVFLRAHRDSLSLLSLRTAHNWTRCEVHGSRPQAQATCASARGNSCGSPPTTRAKRTSRNTEIVEWRMAGFQDLVARFETGTLPFIVATDLISSI